MKTAAILYLLITFGLFAIFSGIVFWVLRGKRKKRLEAPKHRMLDDD
ncbi:MAG: cbb3-type cytochrome c oxidase subunit 3 [Desulfurivibrio sp.]|nr:cbb3-type cytochrome c oxidase subunit 3 [Desulfurivibrio sp.]